MSYAQTYGLEPVTDPVILREIVRLADADRAVEENVVSAEEQAPRETHVSIVRVGLTIYLLFEGGASTAQWAYRQVA